MKIELNKIYCGDALEVLKQMPDEIVNCVVTSPPYWGLRDYGTAKWEGGNPDCDHFITKLSSNKSTLHEAPEKKKMETGIPYKDICSKCGAKRIDNQLGLEKTPEEYVQKLVEIFREVKRVLRKDGTVWLNLGDSYASGKGTCYNPGGNTSSFNVHLKAANVHPLDMGNKKILERSGFKPKDLVGIPWMTAFALRADGWYLRQDLIWYKKNPMPENVTNRCTKSHEYIFLLAKSGKTIFWKHRDKGIKERVYKKPEPDYRWINKKTEEEITSDPKDKKKWGRINLWHGCDYYFDQNAIKTEMKDISIERAKRGLSEDNKWHHGAPGSTAHSISKPRPNVTKEWKTSDGWDTGKGSHGSFHKNGREKGYKGYEHRGIGSDEKLTGHSGNFDAAGRIIGDGRANKRSVWEVPTKGYSEAHFATFPPKLIEDCIKAGSPIGGIVLDPFMGAGTTAIVTRKQDKNYIGIELNPEYIKISDKRMSEELGMWK